MNPFINAKQIESNSQPFQQIELKDCSITEKQRRREKSIRKAVDQLLPSLGVDVVCAQSLPPISIDYYDVIRSSETKIHLKKRTEPQSSFYFSVVTENLATKLFIKTQVTEYARKITAVHLDFPIGKEISIPLEVKRRCEEKLQSAECPENDGSIEMMKILS